MRKFLHITEYSSEIPYKVPVKESYEHELKLNNSVIRSTVQNSYGTIQGEGYQSIFNDSKMEEKTIPLDKVIIYDELNINDEQEIAYVYECPICLNTTITSNSNLDFCPHCENSKFPPKVVALINTKQMEEIATEDSDVSTLIVVKDNEIIFKDLPNKVVGND